MKCATECRIFLQFGTSAEKVPLLAWSRETIWTCILSFFLFCSGCSRIMHDGNGDAIFYFFFNFFYCILHHTHLESFRDFNSLHSASESAKTKQKEKVWRIVSNVSPKRKAANANDCHVKTIAEPREQQVVPARRCRVFFLFLNLAFIIFIYHFVYYHFHKCAKLFNKSIKNMINKKQLSTYYSKTKRGRKCFSGEKKLQNFIFLHLGNVKHNFCEQTSK